MFSSLKNKIKEETGSEITPKNGVQHNNNRVRSRLSSMISVNSTSEDGVQMGSDISEHIINLRSQCNELTTKVTDLTTRLQTTLEEKNRVEKTNEILLESVKVAQTQKDLYCEEQEKIQNIQQNEIEKLKNLLLFREQEAMDRLASIRQNEQQIENFTVELQRLKNLEALVENLKDELEQLRHSSQVGKNNLTTTLAAVEEENRNLKMRLQIVEQSRIDTLSKLNTDEKMQALIQERRLLEQHLEEAHLQLSDIKSSWSGQNLALETQVSRLSKQVAEETTEKRKALKARDDLVEKIKKLDFEVIKLKNEIEQRNDKIKLLGEEIDELSLALKECREDSEQRILYERSKAEILQTESSELKTRLTATDERFSEYAANADQIAQTLRQQNVELQKDLNEVRTNLEDERSEKILEIKKNEEILKSVEALKNDLSIERDESHKLYENYLQLKTELKSNQEEVSTCKLALEESKTNLEVSEEKLKEFEDMQREIDEKNKTIKILNQRLNDIKKTVQKEFRHTKSFDIDNAEKNILNEHTSVIPVPSTTTTNVLCKCCSNTLSDDVIVMNEVNFKYLKHVIVKFLTSREVEAKQLVRAVATLLKLSKEEEKLLHDTINWKLSWFGTKPNHGSGQRAFSIPPS